MNIRLTRIAKLVILFVWRSNRYSDQGTDR